jgi:hypothetical protein
MKNNFFLNFFSCLKKHVKIMLKKQRKKRKKQRKKRKILSKNPKKQRKNKARFVLLKLCYLVKII